MNRQAWVWAVNLVFGLACFEVARRTDSLWSLGIWFVVLLVQFAVMKVRQHLSHELIGKANDALIGGRYVDAIELFTKAQAYGHEGAHVGVALGNLGLWRLERARSALRSASPFRWREQKLHDQQIVAVVDALEGARVWPATELADLPQPIIALVHGLWAARNREWSNVLRNVPPDMVRPLSGQLRAIAEALRAWALRESQQPMPPVDLVGVLGETGPDAVRTYWPEFAGFLESAAQR